MAHHPTDQHRARKRFGQNFLVDEGIIHRIVRAIGSQPHDQLVEIGPGKGAITDSLVGQCARLSVIELDRDLVPMLHEKFAKYDHFQLFQADALKFDFAQLCDEKHKPLRIVGNLPYNISTPLIFHLLSYHAQVKDMHFMLQKEVVQRMAANENDKAYGRLSIMVQYYCAVEHVFDVPPGAFQPAPKVNSAIVRLTPYAQPPHPVNNMSLFERLVNTAFQQRRKTLRNTLKQLVNADIIDSLPVDASARPETLSIATFVNLCNAIEPHIIEKQ